MTDSPELQTALRRHLEWWGLRDVESDERYDEWQRRALTPHQRARLTNLLEARRRSQSAAADIAFYDASADPAVVPILYSQRYAFYAAVGPAMGERFGPAQRILEVGCGPGILTTFYAAQFQDRQFLGLDRSPACIETAREHAASLNLTNLHLACADLTAWTPEAPVDLILSAQALYQAEQDPGLPSRSWRTFERPEDPERQRGFERRTGVGRRLDRLPGLLGPSGRLLLFEKTGHLARRVPFQRALAARGFRLLDAPLPLPSARGETEAGADLLYLLQKDPGDGSLGEGFPWPESPRIAPFDDVSICRGAAATTNWTRLPEKKVTAASRPAGARGGEVGTELGSSAAFLTYLYMAAGSSPPVLLLSTKVAASSLSSLYQRVSTTSADPVAVLTKELGPDVTQAGEDPAETPLYENHRAAAQACWEALPERAVERQAEASETDGRQLHIELGTAASLAYVYCSNTFDQRQLVLMDQSRRGLLEAYYAELFEANRSALNAPA